MKHKFFSKRGFALFVSLMMCVNALSVTAWAGSFSQLQDLIKDGGNVTLTEDYAYDETNDGSTDSITVNNSVNLNLNGYTITGSGKDSVIKVENGGNLTLKDEATDGAKANGTGTITSKESDTHPEYGGGILVNGGSLTMGGGTISGNTTIRGGSGVYVTGNGSFEMKGGEISDNTTTIGIDPTLRGGAGVLVNGGSFTMEEGTITSNTATGSGGGVHVTGNNSTFIMEGGKISGNTAANDGEGGGVHVSNGAKFTMNKGEITNNNANSSWGGGGVRVWNATFEMNGGSITGNKATSNHANAQGTDTLAAGSNNNSTTVAIKGGTMDHQDSIKEHYVPNGYGEIKGDGTCEIVEHSNEVHHDGEVTITTPATCTTDGVEHHSCKVTGCGGYDVTIPALGHAYTSEVTIEPQVGVRGVRTYTCTRCGATRTEEIDPLVEEPVVIIPDVELPLADLPEETAEIADEEVPLAGLVSLAQLLDALYRHEDSPAVELPEEFPFAEHDYAAAICWGLDNALVLNTEEEPLDPDEIITVALLREVLENFVAYKGVELTVTVDGEDDELVMDLGDRLSAFFQLLDEAAA